MAEAEVHSSAVGLLDVLRIVPQDVLMKSLWLYLGDEGHEAGLPSPDPSCELGRPLRLACRDTLRLADQLVRRLLIPVSDDAEADDQPARLALLVRQSNLMQLILQDTSVSGDSPRLIQTLQSGGASSQHLAGLIITSRGTCTAAVGAAVHSCCPLLTTLELAVGHVDGAFFEPWASQGNDLMQVTVKSMDGDTEVTGVVAALANVHALTSVTLAGWLDAAAAAPLRSLTRLTTLDMKGLTLRGAAGGGAHLGDTLSALTLLKTLRLPDIDTREADECSSFVNDVTSRLGGLVRVKHLHLVHLKPDVHLDAGFVALCCLTVLKTLTGPPFAAQDAGAPHGRLPRLCSLIITTFVSGDDLLATLRPLLPLAALRAVSIRVSLTDPRHQGVLGDNGLTQDRAVDSMAQAAALLAAAPVLDDVSLTICTQGHTRSAVGIATALLVPLLGRVTSLRLIGLHDWDVDALSPLIRLAHSLESLHLVVLSTHESGLLLTVGQHLPALQRLVVVECEGVSGDTAVALAAARVTPLQVAWEPALTAGQRRAFLMAARPEVVLEE